MLGNCWCQNLGDEDWHGKEHHWEQPRFFYRTTTRMAFHNTLSYNEDISRALVELKARGYQTRAGSLILLKSGLFRGEIFLEITPPQDEKDPHCLKLQGSFYSYITKTPPSQMGRVIDRVLRDLKKEGKKAQDIYLIMLTCPQCVKAKGNRNLILVHLR